MGHEYPQSLTPEVKKLSLALHLWLLLSQQCAAGCGCALCEKTLGRCTNSVYAAI